MFASLRLPAFLFLFALTLGASSPASASDPELDARARRCAEVFRELRATPERDVPADLLARSRCLAVIPNVVKAAWFFGGHYGKGLLTCRSDRGEWSPPVHVLLTGGSFGLQFGASSTDVVLFFQSEKSVRSLLSSKVKLSGEAGVAAGPVGRGASAATDLKLGAEIYSYARARGLFVGVSLEGAYLGVDADDTRGFYGKRYAPESILFEGEVTNVPKSGWTFLGVLPRSEASTF
jgi:lipid-binding SYLF domain-containing protein